MLSILSILISLSSKLKFLAEHKASEVRSSHNQIDLAEYKRELMVKYHRHWRI